MKFMFAMIASMIFSAGALADLPAVRCQSLFTGENEPKVSLEIESTMGGFTQQDAHLSVQDGQTVVNRELVVWAHRFGPFNRVTYRGFEGNMTLEIDFGFDREPSQFRNYDATLQSGDVRGGELLHRMTCEFSPF